MFAFRCWCLLFKMFIILLTLVFEICNCAHFGEELTGLPGVIQIGNQVQPFGGGGSPINFPQRIIDSKENEIIRSQAFGQEAATSPYWGDNQGRSASQVPDVSPEFFAPAPHNCSRSSLVCDPSSPYRTINGYCNNLLFPEYGSSRQPMTRILPASFDEGLMRIRSVTGKLLPNPRSVSLGIRNVPPRKRTTYNLMVMQMGQFIDHDFSVVPEMKGPGGSKIDCKDCNSFRNPACAPIPIPLDDPFFPTRSFPSGQPSCLPFTRSVGLGGRDSFGRLTIDPMNENTAYLDLSTVYGSDECREKTLRAYSSGQLLEIKQPDSFLKGLPPFVDKSNFEECRSSEQKCFLSGDDRTNEHMGILIMHMVFLREHNRLAHQLNKVNPHWNDNRLFQEARRINIAQYQHVLYSQFLPILIGSQRMADYKLNPEKTGYYQGYNDRTNPSVLTEFSSSAFRMGHTIIPAHFAFFDKNFLPQTSVSLVDFFHNITTAFKPGTCDAILRGLLGTRIGGVDLALESVILDQLFEVAGNFHSGQDLCARNIARSRAHGVASYTQYRAACGGGSTSSFEDLSRVMSQQAINAFRQIYANVEDIDLFVGGLAEDPLPGGVLGSTLSCIIGFQFLNAKRGDRFWYENAAAGFTTAQLHAIRSTASLSRVLCDNQDHDPDNFCTKGKHDIRVPLDSFRIPSPTENPLWACDRIPSLDLNLWKETNIKEPSPCTYHGVVYQWQKFVNVSPCLTCICQVEGLLKCEPNLSGCGTPDPDDHCMALCDRSRL